MAISNLGKGRMHKVGKNKPTEAEKIVYKRIKAFVSKNISIWVNEVIKGEFFITLYGEDNFKYGSKIANQIIFSNYLRFIFEDIEPLYNNGGWYKIGGALR
jgi:hypothetical protein